MRITLREVSGGMLRRSRVVGGGEPVILDKEWDESVLKVNEADVLKLPSHGGINQVRLEVQFGISLLTAPSCVGGTKIP